MDNNQDKKIEFDPILNCYKCTGCYSFSKRENMFTHSIDCPVYIQQIEDEEEKRFESNITMKQLAEMMGMSDE